MENYYKQKAEMEIARERLNSKLEEKEMVYLRFFGAKELDSNFTTNNYHPQDKVTDYLIELEERGIDKEIEDLRNEVNVKKYYLKKMETVLEDLKGLEYEFLKLRYFEKRKYTLEEISIKLNYSIDRIKQISSKVEQSIKRYYTPITPKR